MDLLNEEQIFELEGLLKKLNPKASIVRSSYGKIDLKMALNTKKFQFDELQEMRGWLQELQGDFASTSEDPLEIILNIV